MSTPTTPDRRRLPAFATLLFGAALIAVACGPNATASPSVSAAPPPSAVPTDAPSVPAVAPSSSAAALDAIYDKVEQQVIAIRGLQPTKPVERDFITAAEAKALLTADFDKETPEVADTWQK